MNETTVAEQVTKRADELVVGDCIDANLLPFHFDQRDGEVVFARLHHYRSARWVFVAFKKDDGYHDCTSFRPDAAIKVTPAVDPLGDTFGREPDEHGPAEDMTVTRPRRREPHFEDGRVPYGCDGDPCTIPHHHGERASES